MESVLLRLDSDRPKGELQWPSSRAGGFLAPQAIAFLPPPPQTLRGGLHRFQGSHRDYVTFAVHARQYKQMRKRLECISPLAASTFRQTNNSRSFQKEKHVSLWQRRGGEGRQRNNDDKLHASRYIPSPDQCGPRAACIRDRPWLHICRHARLALIRILHEMVEMPDC